MNRIRAVSGEPNIVAMELRDGIVSRKEERERWTEVKCVNGGSRHFQSAAWRWTVGDLGAWGDYS